jgi:hypothetical protein
MNDFVVVLLPQNRQDLGRFESQDFPDISGIEIDKPLGEDCAIRSDTDNGIAWQEFSLDGCYSRRQKAFSFFQQSLSGAFVDHQPAAWPEGVGNPVFTTGQTGCLGQK